MGLPRTETSRGMITSDERTVRYGVRKGYKRRSNIAKRGQHFFFWIFSRRNSLYIYFLHADRPNPKNQKERKKVTGIFEIQRDQGDPVVE